MYYLDLAMRLKRTLVLPRTRLVKRLPGGGSRFDPNADYIGWGDLYNVSALSALHSVIEFDQYTELYGHQVTVHVQNVQSGCTESEDSAMVPFNGRQMQASRTICGRGLQHQVARLQSAELVGVESIAFGNCVDQLSLPQALVLRPYVRFEHGVYDAAHGFVRQAFGDEPFLAIHWRRTDFLAVRRSQAGVLQSADALVAHAQRLMRRHGISRVYLATDSDDHEELLTVEQALQPSRYMAGAAHDRKLTLVQKTRVANVEIAICAMADRFLGTKTSSFTLAIAEERQAVFGMTSASGSEMDDLKEEAKDEL